ncbi:hypothetical protein MmiAt1_04280 [Methanimicrococcus sp. At1]|uniref:Transglutaminase-like domain-containing protein n=1 Tax=Methanimicrococcus hacksteinii TaxID=3028293 RepID=A0ABU3VNA4_9EURY|nr:transglutaminase-like domain-containing protein [Methanimicrococcus sp. At1]MDV0444882.1 hypothetical protein [Methanimicrococcus sp. At1]
MVRPQFHRVLLYGTLAACLMLSLTLFSAYIIYAHSADGENVPGFEYSAEEFHLNHFLIMESKAAAPIASLSKVPDIHPAGTARSFEWYYNGETHTYTYSGPTELYEYYVNKTHERDDYNQYALSEYDRLIMREIADYFKEYGRLNNHSEKEITENVIAFVQSISYTTDIETTGKEDYPRYPVETLVDGTGDCEDSVILAAAVLYELGYESILILVPDHMALGVKDTGSYSGRYYEYEGSKYYYIETTSQGHVIGTVPDSVNP